MLDSHTRATWAAAALATALVATGGAHAQSQTTSYRVDFEALWSEATHPQEFPTGLAHFSPLVGATHDASVGFWLPGALASAGIEDMAENGASSPLDAEIAAAGAAGGMFILDHAAFASPGAAHVNITLTQTHPLLTLVTMLAPSPDWFAGVHDLALFDGTQWVQNASVDVFAYDAGTDSGPTFVSPNQDTVPAQPISLITTGPLAGGVPVGRLTLTRLADIGCDVEVSQPSYEVGETIALTRWQLTNVGAVPGGVEIKLFLRIGTDGPLGIFNIGSDGTIIVEPGADIDLGTGALAAVGFGFPSGPWQIGCRVVDPDSGAELDLDVADFTVDGG